MLLGVEAVNSKSVISRYSGPRILRRGFEATEIKKKEGWCFVKDRIGEWKKTLVGKVAGKSIQRGMS